MSKNRDLGNYGNAALLDADSTATANTVVQRTGNGSINVTNVTASGTITGTVSGTADALTTARTIALSGDVSGSASFDGSANVTITATVADDSHNHIISNVDGLQSALDAKVDSVVGKGLSTEDYTTAEKNKLAGIEAGAEVNTVTSVATKTGAVTLDKADVGLANVDNTSDLNKPISTATQTALNLKAPLASPALSGTPTAPTAVVGTNTTQIATTAFVQGAVSGLVDAAPATLDTLNELAAALGDDPNFATTVSTQIGTKLDASAYTAADVLTKIKTVDGAASGLDADLLDGQHASAFAAASHTHTIANVTGLQGALDGKAPLTGAGTSGTWPISVTGNAASASSANSSTISSLLVAEDNRTISPSEIPTSRMKFGFTSWNNNNGSPYADFIHMRGYTDSSGGSDNLLMFSKSGLGMRLWQQSYGSGTAYSSYKDVAWTDGTNASGTWGINITGNADTVDGYHASSLWRSDGGVWNPGANITLNQAANGQEWSFDISRNGYSGGYWHVWDSSHSTMLGVDATSNFVYATGSSRAPIFYDYNDTAYYIDPNGSTSLFSNGVVVAGNQGFQSRFWASGVRNRIWSFYNSDNYGISYFQGSSGVGGADTIGIHPNGGATASGSTLQVVSGYTQSLGSMRAPIFYNSNDTSNRFQQGELILRNASPTVYLRDTNHNSAMLHCNSNLFYILRGGNDTETWSTVNGHWPVYWDLTNNNASFGGSITAVGNVTAFSDAKLKENIVTIDSALEKTLRLRGVYYTLKADETKTNKLGVIAQEVREVVPEVVMLHQDAEDIEGTLTVDYGNMVGLLIEAIKEQQTHIERLESIINKAIEEGKL